MTIMEKNAAEYGLDDVQMDPPLEYDTVEIAAPTSLALVSDITETPVAELAALNPAILKGIAPANYALHVPKGAGNQLMAALAAGSARSIAMPGACTAWAPAKRWRPSASVTPPRPAVSWPPTTCPRPSRGRRPAGDSRGPARARLPSGAPPPRGPRRARTSAHRPHARPPHRGKGARGQAHALPAQPVHKSPPILTRTASR